MANKEEFNIKIECLEDLDTTMEIVKESDHPEKIRILASLVMIEKFCDRWWER